MLSGDIVGPACRVNQSQQQRGSLGSEWQGDFERFTLGRLACTNGDAAEAEAESDAERMTSILKLFIRQYAIFTNNADPVDSVIDNVPDADKLGLARLATDQEHLTAMPVLLAWREQYTSALNMGLFEYAALQGCIAILRVLVDYGFDVYSDETTHPVSAAITSGSIETAQLLFDGGADIGDRNRRSVIKQYTQAPLIIAARHLHVEIIRFLVTKGQSLRKGNTYHDALAAALVNRRSNMVLCLLRSGLILLPTDPSLEALLGVGLAYKNDPLTYRVLRDRVHHNVKELYVDSPNRYHEGELRTKITFYGNLFQWACSQGFEHIVDAFLDRGVESMTPVKSWANTYVDRPILVAWLCKYSDVVRPILDHYDDTGLVQLSCHIVMKGHAEFFDLTKERSGVQQNASWLLRKCLACIGRKDWIKTGRLARSVHKLRNRQVLRTLIVIVLLLPPDIVWDFSEYFS